MWLRKELRIFEYCFMLFEMHFVEEIWIDLYCVLLNFWCFWWWCIRDLTNIICNTFIPWYLSLFLSLFLRHKSLYLLYLLVCTFLCVDLALEVLFCWLTFWYFILTMEKVAISHASSKISFSNKLYIFISIRVEI